MKSVLNTSKKIFYIIFAIFFIFILIGTIFFNKTAMSSINALESIISIILYFGFMFAIYKILNKYIKNKKVFIVAMFLLFFITQIIFSYIFVVKPSWDFGEIFESAKDDITINKNLFKNSYFYLYSNNLGGTLLLKLLFAPFNLIGVNSNYFLHIGIIFNIFMIDLALLYLYKTLKLFFDENQSYFFLICSLFISPFITYAPIFYTDTLTMPFIIIALYYFIKPFINKNYNPLYFIISGISIGIGTNIKFSVIILGISFLIWLIYHKEKMIIKLKNIFFLLVCTTIIILNFNTFINNNLDQERLHKNKFPITHWIMMGLEISEYNWPGGYSTKDVRYTNSFRSIEEKKIANKKEIKKRIKKHIKNKNLISFYYKKAIFVWGDGSFFAPVKLERYPIKNYKIKKLILGNNKQNLIYRCFSQAQIILMLLFTIFSIINKKYLSDKQKDLLFLTSITIFGTLLFFLIWEARSRYIVNYIPVILLQTYLGVIAVYNKIKYNYKSKEINKEKK